MFFLPYRLDHQLNKLPIVTWVVCILCIFMFWQQVGSDQQYDAALNKFCTKSLDRHTRDILKTVQTKEGVIQCGDLFHSIRESDAPSERLSSLAKNAKPMNLFEEKLQENEYVHGILQAAYEEFKREVPYNITYERWYEPEDIDIVRMLSSSFSHGSWQHLGFNLLFFYVFAASIELIVGLVVFPLIILTMCITTSVAYSYGLFGTNATLPTVGLSGVVMGMMAMLAILMPHVRIKVFIWILVFFRVISVPALFVTLWYVAWDIFGLRLSDESTDVDYVAHVSGAATGALLAIGVLLFNPKFMDRQPSG